MLFFYVMDKAHLYLCYLFKKISISISYCRYFLSIVNLLYFQYQMSFYYLRVTVVLDVCRWTHLTAQMYIYHYPTYTTQLHWIMICMRIKFITPICIKMSLGRRNTMEHIVGTKITSTSSSLWLLQ